MPMETTKFKEMKSVYPFVFECECNRRHVVSLQTGKIVCQCGAVWIKRPGYLFCRTPGGTWMLPVKE